MRTTKQRAFFAIYRNLDRLNRLPAEEAEALFLDCAGSGRWAEHMAAARPFPMVEHLFNAANRYLHTLDEPELRSALLRITSGATPRHFAKSSGRSIFVVGGSGSENSEDTLRTLPPEAALPESSGSTLHRLQRETEKRLSSLLEK